MTSEGLTKAQAAFLGSYRPGSQNGVEYDVQTVWTRANGNTIPGLVASREAGLITSAPDDILHSGGWRHDLTPAGRAALAASRSPAPVGGGLGSAGDHDPTTGATAGGQPQSGAR